MKLGKLGMIAAAFGLMGMGAMTEVNNSQGKTQSVSKENAGNSRNNQNQATNEGSIFQNEESTIITNYRGNDVIYNNNIRCPKEWGMYLQSTGRQKWNKKRKF